MKLLLHADVDGLGRRGDLVDVADGYARNYLLPKGLGHKATATMEAQAGAMRSARIAQSAADRAEAEEVATRLVPMVINVAAKATGEGHLFGSVGAAEVAAAVEAQTGVVLDVHNVEEAHIKEVGTHSLAVRLHPEVQFPLTVEVAAE